MYVCVCSAVTDSDIRNAVVDGVRNLRQLKRATGCSSTCGCCRQEATDVLQKALSEKGDTQRLLPVIQVA